ncbi:disease resistance protein PIK6-NP-like [Triticum urartu]|uniref:Rx N-terminal domain-containing protein n=1 Tax=Triticum urartu TaxID=4572 RepID=A0A8R7NXS1_TRIUA|nr:disease resistance protein PIK6-NP-like [Triticum urartu]
MMQCFLNTTDEERAKNAVVKAWVRQIRDLAYDVEDCIEFVVHLDNKPAWWWRVVPSCMAPPLPLDQAVNNITELKARVQDVSQRNMRYNLVNDSGSKPFVAQPHPPHPPITGAAKFDMLAQAKDAAKKQHVLWNLADLVNRQDRALEVISLWGTGGDLGMTSIVRKAYVDPEIRRNFTCRAWVKIMHPFNPDEFIQSFLAQLHARSRQEQ